METRSRSFVPWIWRARSPERPGRCGHCGEGLLPQTRRRVKADHSQSLEVPTFVVRRAPPPEARPASTLPPKGKSGRGAPSRREVGKWRALRSLWRAPGRLRRPGASPIPDQLQSDCYSFLNRGSGVLLLLLCFILLGLSLSLFADLGLIALRLGNLFFRFLGYRLIGGGFFFGSGLLGLL